jgi:hypothetical protein
MQRLRTEWLSPTSPAGQNLTCSRWLYVFSIISGLELLFIRLGLQAIVNDSSLTMQQTCVQTVSLFKSVSSDVLVELGQRMRAHFVAMMHLRPMLADDNHTSTAGVARDQAPQTAKGADPRDRINPIAICGNLSAVMDKVDAMAGASQNSNETDGSGMKRRGICETNGHAGVFFFQAKMSEFECARIFCLLKFLLSVGGTSQHRVHGNNSSDGTGSRLMAPGVLPAGANLIHMPSLTGNKSATAI